MDGVKINEKEHSEKDGTEGSSDNGKVRNVRGNGREDEPSSYRLYKTYGGNGSLHEMPCKGSFKTASYCNVCGLRENLCGEVAQKNSKNMQSGMPCGIWENLRKQAMEQFWESGEPDIPRVITHIEHRTERIKCLGNAVVPQQFYPFFQAIAIMEEEMRRNDQD